MSTNNVQQLISDYARNHESRYLAPDATFTIMTTGDRWEGRQAIENALTWLYHQAFEAHADVTDLVVEGDKAAVELVFRGRHTGEFFGIDPTGREVNVPFCIVYHLSGDQITAAHIYLEMSTLVHQISSGPPSSQPPQWPGD